MVSAHPHANGEARVILCRNRRTGLFVWIDRSRLPEVGQLVAVRSRTGLRVEAFSGQAIVGVIVENAETESPHLLPG